MKTNNNSFPLYFNPSDLNMSIGVFLFLYFIMIILKSCKYLYKYKTTKNYFTFRTPMASFFELMSRLS